MIQHLKPGRSLISIVLFLCTFQMPTCATWAQTAYASVGNTIGTIDLETGIYTKIASNSTVFNALTFGLDGTLYGEGSDGNLYSINTTTGAPTLLSLNPANNQPGSLAAKNKSTLVGYSIGGDAYYFVPTNGSATTFGGSNNLSNSQMGLGALSYGPGSLLYADMYNGSERNLYQVNANTGFVTAIGTGFGFTDSLALASDGTTLFGVNTDTNQGDIGLYTIDTSIGVATSTGLTVSNMPINTNVRAIAISAVTPEPGSGAICLGLGFATCLVWIRRIGRSYPACPNYSDEMTARLIDHHLAELPMTSATGQSEGRGGV